MSDQTAGLSDTRYVKGYHHCPILAEKKLYMYNVEHCQFPVDEEGSDGGTLCIIDISSGEALHINGIKFCPFCGIKLDPQLEYGKDWKG